MIQCNHLVQKDQQFLQLQGEKPTPATGNWASFGKMVIMEPYITSP